MLKRTTLLLVVITGSLALTGCSIKANYYTKVKKAPLNKQIAFIEADQDSTSLGLINVGNVTRTNYLYAFGTAAQTTLDNGYKYFTIIEPTELTEQYIDRDVHNLQEAYDACDRGKNSFKVMTNRLIADIHNNHCDHIIDERYQATLFGGQVTHRAIKFTIEMHNEPMPNSNATFDAQNVLQSDLLKDLNKKYFKENVR